MSCTSTCAGRIVEVGDIHRTLADQESYGIDPKWI